MHRLFAWASGWLTQRLGRTRPREPLASLREEVHKAHADWQRAQAHFDMVSSPPLVDHAIYQLEASCRRYVYLWSQLRDLEGSVVRVTLPQGQALVDSAQ